MCRAVLSRLLGHRAHGVVRFGCGAADAVGNPAWGGVNGALSTEIIPNHRTSIHGLARVVKRQSARRPASFAGVAAARRAMPCDSSLYISDQAGGP